MRKDCTEAQFICLDCPTNTGSEHEYYTVHDPVWLSVVASRHAGILCIGCLEARLGRLLCGADFPDYPINRDIFHQSDRLKGRLNA